MPDPQKILATIRRATDLSRATPGRVGAVVHLGGEVEDVVVMGDLHGHIHNFAGLMTVAALGKHPTRHLVVQELVHDPRTDPDGEAGDLSHRLVDLVCALKCQFPDRVHYLPGNHELSELTGRSIAKNGVPLNALFRKGIETTYGTMAGPIRAAYDELFRALPLAVKTVNRIFLCHTIPDAQFLDTFDVSVLTAEDWPLESLERGSAVYAMTWGRDTAIETAERFAELVDADLFICGHQPCDEGFRRANDRLLILDGTDPLPVYCRFPARGPVTMDALVAGVKSIPRRE
ncbi:MAG: hypothetical protein JWN86_242 [Planctomycetota bacterium]|nr:hypothetical protein [Planctomycetota bacterium]